MGADFFEGLFQSAILLYENNSFPYVIAGWMAFIALVLIIIATAKTLIVDRAIKRRTVLLSEICKQSEDSVADCRQSFYDEFGRINDDITKPLSFLENRTGLNGFRLAWMEFEESLIRSDEEPQEARKFRNTVRPQGFFFRSVTPPHWLDFWANLAVGAGLLFTFLGLVAALKFANDGITAGGMGEMQASLATLLAAASAKFVTSIMGVGLSMLLKVFHKTLAFVLKRRISEVCHKLETALLYVAPQTLATKQLELAEEQRDLIKEQANEIGMQFREQLEPLHETLRQSAAEQQKAIHDGIGDMVGDEAKRQFDKMSEALGGLSVTLGSLGGELRSSGQLASEQIGSAAGALQGMMEGLPDQLSMASSGAAKAIADAGLESANNMRAVQEGFDKTASDLTRITPVLEQWESSTGEAMQALSSTLSGMRETLEESSVLGAELSKANQELRAALEASDSRIRAGTEAVVNANKNAATLATSLTSTQSQIQSTWKQYESRFEEIDNSLGSAVQALGAAFQDHQDSLSSHLGTLDNRLASAVGNLSGVVGELDELVSSIHDVANR